MLCFALAVFAIAGSACSTDSGGRGGLAANRQLTASMAGGTVPSTNAGRPDPPARQSLPDPGAVMLVGDLEAAIPDIEVSTGAVRVSMEGLRNHSRRRTDAYDRLRSELLGMLLHAGSGRLEFVGQDFAAPFVINGAAYAIPENRRGGWEIYLTVIDRKTNRVLWRSPGPIRVLNVGGPDEDASIVFSPHR